MATLIPSYSSCASRMTGGERRLAQRLEAKLDDDYLLWYDVPVGPKVLHPDFINFGTTLTGAQIDRIRWHLYPEMRISAKQFSFFDDEPADTLQTAIPQVLKVMDLQSEGYLSHTSAQQ